MEETAKRKYTSKMHTYAIEFDTGEVYKEQAVSRIKAMLKHCKKYDVELEWLLNNSCIYRIA